MILKISTLRPLVQRLPLATSYCCSVKSQHRYSSNGGTTKTARPSYVHVPADKEYLGITLGELVTRSAEKYSTREALVSVHQNIRKTFEELDRDVSQLAAGFLAIGLQRGDRIAMWGPNSYEWVLTMLAASKAGMILVTINPAYQQSEAEYCLNLVKAKAVVVPEGFKSQNYYKMLTEIVPELPTSRPGCINSKRVPSLNAVILVDSIDYPGTYNFNQVLTAAGSKETKELQSLQEQLSVDDVVNIQFTSGTTGKAKGVMLSHHNLGNNALFYGKRLKYGDREQRACIPVPLFHCFGCVVGMLCSLTYGVTQVYPAPSFRALPVLQAIEAERCTIMYGTPTMFADILSLPDVSKYNTSSLSTGMMSGAPCPEELLKKVGDVLGAHNFVVGYGLTETSPVVFLGNPTDSIEKRVCTVGYPLDHVEAKVVDNQGRIVPRGTSGELWVRGYMIMKGYWEDEDKTAAAVTKDGWFKTGDTFVIRDDDYGMVVGRIKDMIIRGGENIYPREIEEFLYTHPSIAEVQVCGVPDVRMGEEVCAWVKLKPDHQALSEADVKEFCKGKIAHFKIPKYIMFVEDYPKTYSGKIEKYKMAQQSIKILKLDSQGGN